MQSHCKFHRCLSFIVLLALLLPLAPVSSLMAHRGALPFTAQALETITADTVAPAAVLNLVAEPGPAPGSVVLSWIAPGDDATTGTASTYIVRYNTTNITESNWAASTDVSGEPAPSPAGSVESMTVSSLWPGQRYYFAIKTQDEVPNTSSISNSPRAVVQASFNTVYLPLVASSMTNVPTVIPETTEILTETTTQHLSKISDDGAIFTFTQSTADLNALEAEDVMVSGVTANVPSGFLRKVTSVSSNGGRVIVETEQATLEEAIETGAVQLSHALTPGQVQTSTQLTGVRLATVEGLQDDFYLKF
jgi:hypothetical protein